MPIIKLNSRRRATVPNDVCDQLHVREGDEPENAKAIDWSWVGSVKVPANVSHAVVDVRRSIARRRRRAR